MQPLRIALVIRINLFRKRNIASLDRFEILFNAAVFATCVAYGEEVNNHKEYIARYIRLALRSQFQAALHPRCIKYSE